MLSIFADLITFSCGVGLVSAGLGGLVALFTDKATLVACHVQLGPEVGQ